METSRAKEIIKKVMNLTEEEVAGYHSSYFTGIFKTPSAGSLIYFLRHCERLEKLLSGIGIDLNSISQYRKLLIGSYFTHEYSIESSAFFNPSCVEDPDQSELVEGQKRVIISFRAVGEGHISSIAFRRAIIDHNNNITVIPAGEYIDEAEVIRNAIYKKELFFNKAIESNIAPDVIEEVKSKLADHFEYLTLQTVIKRMIEREGNGRIKKNRVKQSSVVGRCIS